MPSYSLTLTSSQTPNINTLFSLNVCNIRHKSLYRFRALYETKSLLQCHVVLEDLSAYECVASSHGNDLLHSLFPFHSWTFARQPADSVKPHPQREHIMRWVGPQPERIRLDAINWQYKNDSCNVGRYGKKLLRNSGQFRERFWKTNQYIYTHS